MAALRNLLIAKATRSQVRFWFCLSLAFAIVYGILCVRQSFAGDYVVQDDVRQHVFWMRRFLDRTLFPGDLIADYFQSVAPPGYTALYWLPAQLGIDPLAFNRVLPLVLGTATAAYCFGVCLEILPIPVAGFAASLLLSQTLWMKDGLASATPRAFACPLLLAFAYYLLRNSLVPCLVAIALLGLVYPHNTFIAGGVLVVRLIQWRDGKPGISRDRRDWQFCLLGLGVIALVLLPYALQSSEFGPTITVAEARTLPEFFRKGRTPFFHSDPWEFWLFGRGSGFFPSSLPLLVLLGLLLPILMRFPARFPLVRQVTGGVALLPQLFLASLGMFLLAHALLFRLHLPNRYTGASLRVLITLAAGVAIVLLLDGILHACDRRGNRGGTAIALVSTLVLGGSLVLYPLALDDFPNPRYLMGAAPSLYQFLAAQPKDTLVASLSEEADNLPTFAQRMTLTGREYGVPFQVGYYRQIRQRAEDLIRAQYSPDLTDVKAVIQKYGVDFWLLDRAAFTPEYVEGHRWLRLFSATPQALASLQKAPPALAAVAPQCTVLEAPQWQLLQASCLAAIGA